LIGGERVGVRAVASTGLISFITVEFFEGYGLLESPKTYLESPLESIKDAALKTWLTAQGSQLS
jgi:hypothetical protein